MCGQISEPQNLVLFNNNKLKAVDFDCARKPKAPVEECTPEYAPPEMIIAATASPPTVVTAL